jgi:transketolase
METTVKLKKRILEVALRDEMGHIPSAFSILDIIWVLYDKIMTPDDQFILSKGHGVMALYAVLEEKGLMIWNEKLMGHPKRGGHILASTGSLGHGLPMAVGLAKAKKIKGEKGRVFCLIGDGECNEGTIWESASLASHHGLDNLVVIVDQNHSSDRALDNKELLYKFYAFGFVGFEMDGHNHNQIYKTLDYEEGRPIIAQANTTKGNGIKDLQLPEWHNKKITKDDYNKFIKELCTDTI